MKESQFNKKEKVFLALALAALLVMTFATTYYGSSDVGDYAETAKFFADEHVGKTRNSHSYILGFIHAPFVGLFENFLIFKISSILVLILITFSVYRISGKNKKALWIMALSPAAWYMAPWINPIQLASLFFLWAWHFMERFDKGEKFTHIALAGVFLGLGWAVWDTIIFFGVVLGAIYLYNKKSINILYLGIFVLLGLSPRLNLDYYLFNFPFYTIFKSTMGTIANSFGGIYSDAWRHSSPTLLRYLTLLLAFPLLYWKLYTKKLFKKEFKALIFISLCLIFILALPQVRYAISLVPIMTVVLARHINPKQFRIQIISSLIIIVLFITPYAIQTNYYMDERLNGAEITYFLENLPSLTFSTQDPNQVIAQDLKKIAERLPNMVFVVGNTPDTYRTIAHPYWDDDIKELVSIQDYQLVARNETIILQRTFKPVPNIRERRQIWIAGGIGKNENDDTDYESIEYGIGLNEPINLEGFEVIEQYEKLYLSKKTSTN